MSHPTQAGPQKARAEIRMPIAMLAELTHRCPLACPYCSNPTELVRRDEELSGREWADVLRQAAGLGVLHVALSGGEPAARRDLEEIVAACRDASLYSNLITSGIGLTERRLRDLKSNGLDHVQLSVQGAEPTSADRFGGYRGGFERKMAVASWIRDNDLPLTINVVMHRQNIDSIEDVLALAIDLGARRIEIATVQFHGWAEKNRGALMPSREQVLRAGLTVQAARERLKGTMVVDYVPADYYATWPKACMGGWASTSLNVAPDGFVLPCHAAGSIPGLVFENVRDRALADIWRNGAAFNAFRGETWMREPCGSCERRSVDFGGCRCQAFALTGNASATDPACSKSPLHARLVASANAQAASGQSDFIYRRMA